MLAAKLVDLAAVELIPLRQLAYMCANRELGELSWAFNPVVY